MERAYRSCARWPLAGALALALLAAACGSDGGQTRCTPGMRWVCPCPDGTMGTQLCGADGYYGECSCPDGRTDAGVLDAPAGDAPAQADGPAQSDGPLPEDAPVTEDAPAQTDTAPQADGPRQDAIVAFACAAGPADQLFQQGMRGCKGTVTFADRATLCGPGFRVCTAEEWVARRGAATPTYNYWTNDVLYANVYHSNHDCAVTLTPPTLPYCDGTDPMRVCTGPTDPLGNTCNWTECGFNQKSPNEYFGGCQNNHTAGALCCPQ